MNAKVKRNVWGLAIFSGLLIVFIFVGFLAYQSLPPGIFNLIQGLIIAILILMAVGFLIFWGTNA